jgi:hypothetical protein
VGPSSGDENGTRRDETGRSEGTIRCEIKALAGNSATCLGFCFRLAVGSIPAASTSTKREWAAELAREKEGRPLAGKTDED